MRKNIKEIRERDTIRRNNGERKTGRRKEERKKYEEGREHLRIKHQ
jgi:hypothetical protein